jgi:nucleotidyltransferase substrate binding protein (TIGR01987 family)
MTTKLNEFEKAVTRLEEALAQEKNDFLRDSVIQRFEFTFELSWKTSKKILGTSSSAPKMIIREMAQEKLISDPQTWFEYLEARNLSTHTYKEDLAEQVYATAKKSLSDFKELLSKLKALE